MPPGPGGNRLGDLGSVAANGFGLTSGVRELPAGHGMARSRAVRDIAVEQHVGLPLVTLDQRIEALDKKRVLRNGPTPISQSPIINIDFNRISSGELYRIDQ